jgi:C_GCAxxG_C_C family probable redox protein
MADPSRDAARLAEAHFHDHYNCCQSVLWGVTEARGLTCETCIPAVALAMGGGIGHTGRACGAVTGAVMAVGLAVDAAFAGVPIGERKDRANREAAALAHRFEAEFGTADCAVLLGFSWEDPDALARYDREGAKENVCLPCVRWAATEAVRLIDNLPGT